MKLTQPHFGGQYDMTILETGAYDIVSALGSIDAPPKFFFPGATINNSSAIHFLASAADVCEIPQRLFYQTDRGQL